MNPIESPQFISDVMLGRLARWLRLLGYDVLFQDTFTDCYLLEEAEKQHRVLLTRDKALYKKAIERGIKALFINHDKYNFQLKQVMNELSLSLERSIFLSRCPQCNCPLINVEKTSIEGEVPDFIYNTKDKFARCNNCKKIYWQGSHIDKIEQFLEKIIK